MIDLGPGRRLAVAELPAVGRPVGPSLRLEPDAGVLALAAVGRARPSRATAGSKSGSGCRRGSRSGRPSASSGAGKTDSGIGENAPSSADGPPAEVGHLLERDFLLVILEVVRPGGQLDGRVLLARGPRSTVCRPGQWTSALPSRNENDASFETVQNRYVPAAGILIQPR